MNSVKIFISIDGTENNGYAFGDNYIKEMKFSNQLMDTSFNINPTVIEQYAEITLKDKHKFIFNLFRSGQLMSDMKVFVYFNNTLKFTYLTSTWDVQIQSSSIVLHCNDPVKKLENIQTQLVSVADRTLNTLLDIGFSLTEYNWTFQDVETQTFAMNTWIKDSYVTYQDLLTYFKKLCLVGFLRIYWRKNTFVIARCYK